MNPRNQPETKNSEISDIEKRLGTPVADELSDNTLRIRRNLIIFCCIVIFSNFYDIEINPCSISAGGMGFTGITTGVIYQILFFIILYNLIHFSVNVFEYLAHNRIHLTGIYAKPSGSFADEHHDRAAGTKQSTLYGWLLCGNLNEDSKDQIIEHFKISFERFEKCFLNFLKIQAFKILFIELLIPIVLAIAALGICFSYFNIKF